MAIHEASTKEVIRYQGAILRDGQILLIKHREHSNGRSYWVIPGGRREGNETEEDCVKREMLEETSLEISVERILLDEAGDPNGNGRRRKTYLCRVVNGEAQPGFEPEEDASNMYAISQVGWFDLRDPSGWEALLTADPFTYPLLVKIQAALDFRTPE